MQIIVLSINIFLYPDAAITALLLLPGTLLYAVFFVIVDHSAIPPLRSRFMTKSERGCCRLFWAFQGDSIINIIIVFVIIF